MPFEPFALPLARGLTDIFRFRGQEGTPTPIPVTFPLPWRQPQGATVMTNGVISGSDGSNPTGWQGLSPGVGVAGSPVVETAVLSPSGNPSLLLSAYPSQIESENIAVTPNTRYTLVYSFKGSGGKAYLKTIRRAWTNSGSSYLNTPHVISDNHPLGNEEWITRIVTFVTYPWETRMRVLFKPDDPDNVLPLYVSDVQLYQGWAMPVEPPVKKAFTGPNNPRIRINGFGFAELSTDGETFEPTFLYGMAQSSRTDYSPYADEGMNVTFYGIFSETWLARSAAASHTTPVNDEDGNPIPRLAGGYVPNWMWAFQDGINNWIAPFSTSYADNDTDKGTFITNLSEFLASPEYAVNFAGHVQDNEFTETTVWNWCVDTLRSLETAAGLAHMPILQLNGVPGKTVQYDADINWVSSYVGIANDQAARAIIYAPGITTPPGPAILNMNFSSPQNVFNERAGVWKWMMTRLLGDGYTGVMMWKDGDIADVTTRPWWTSGEVSYMRRTIEKCWDAIYCPGWTDWDVQVSNDRIYYGTRQGVSGKKYVIVSAPSINAGSCRFTLKTADGTTDEVNGAVYNDYTGAWVAHIVDGVFDLALPGYGAGIYRIEETPDEVLGAGLILNAPLCVDSNGATHTRSASAYRKTATDQLEYKAANAARIGYAADRPGLMIEPAATNLALNSNDNANSAWTATNGTIGTENLQVQDDPDLCPIEYGLDSSGVGIYTQATANFAATSADATMLQSVTAASAAYVFSVWLQRKTGSGTVEITINGGSTWTPVTLPDVTDDLVYKSWKRFEITSTLANPQFGIRVRTSGDAVRWRFAQLEAGIAASSVCPSGSTAATRAKDVSGGFANALDLAGGVISLWINTPFDGNQLTSKILFDGRSNITGTKQGPVIEVSSGNNLKFGVYGNDASLGSKSKYVAANGTNMPKNAWHHLCMSYLPDGTVKGYLNGVEATNVSNLGTWADLVRIGPAKVLDKYNDASPCGGFASHLTTYDSSQVANVAALAAELFAAGMEA